MDAVKKRAANKAEDFLRVIDCILEAVDNKCLAALSYDSGVITDVDEVAVHYGSRRGRGLPNILYILEPRDSVGAHEEFYRALGVIDSVFPKLELEEIVIRMGVRYEMLGAAIGYAAGLRAAGMCKPEARALLKSYLRQFAEKGGLDHDAIGSRAQ